MIWSFGGVFLKMIGLILISVCISRKSLMVMLAVKGRIKGVLSVVFMVLFFYG